MSNFFSRLRLRHGAWCLIIAVIGVWWPLYVLVTPPTFIQGNVDPVIMTICMIVAVTGGFLSILGYLSSQQSEKVGVIGVSIELVGVILAAVGPVSYIASFVSALSSGNVNFGSALILAVGAFCIHLYRSVIIVPRFRLEAYDPTKE